MGAERLRAHLRRPAATRRAAADLLGRALGAAGSLAALTQGYQSAFLACAALTQGYQSAFLACAVLAGIGLALAFLLPGRGSQRTSCQSRTRRPMPLPLPQETW
jgi:hypothetical protein